LRLDYKSIHALSERSDGLGVLTELYEERVDAYLLLKFARGYEKHVVEVRNAKLVRLLEQVFAWIHARMSHAYRRARSRLKELSQARKFRIGVWGSAGLRGDLLHFYLDLKNGSVPAALLMDLYS
jgi:hypothetical protein